MLMSHQRSAIQGAAVGQTPEAIMILANACPRCRGALARVMDIGEVYYSCVHCGHTVYGKVPSETAAHADSRWQGRQAEDRADVRRRLIAKDRARAARRQQAA